jgi:acyl-CoA synthetase (AMP-forming)/AMP-acid ligase II
MRIRHELHYGNRVVRCFTNRPANVDAIFRETVERAPDAIALALGDERLSYGELNRRVDALARGLRKSEIRQGDRLALLLGNCFFARSKPSGRGYKTKTRAWWRMVSIRIIAAPAPVFLIGQHRSLR